MILGLAKIMADVQNRGQLDITSKISYLTTSVQLMFDLRAGDINNFEQHYQKMYELDKRSGHALPSKELQEAVGAHSLGQASHGMFSAEDLLKMRQNGAKFCLEFMNRACSNGGAPASYCSARIPYCNK